MLTLQTGSSMTSCQGYGIFVLSLCLIPDSRAYVWSGLNYGIWEYLLPGEQDTPPRNYTWYDGEKICMTEGGYLSSITSSDEYNYLARHLNLDDVWIGLNDLKQYGVWQWSDGKEFNYPPVNWDPLTYLDHCAAMTTQVSGYAVQIQNCGEHLRPLCKRIINDDEAKVTHPPAPVAGSCHPHWQEAGTNRCYRLFTGPVINCERARDICRSMPYYRAELACANTREEIDLLTRMASTCPNDARIWIGLVKKIGHPGLWMDNTPINEDELNYQPYLGEWEDGCMFLDNLASPTGSWNTMTDASLAYYICQVEKDPENIVEISPALLRAAAVPLVAILTITAKLLSQQ